MNKVVLGGLTKNQARLMIKIVLWLRLFYELRSFMIKVVLRLTKAELNNFIMGLEYIFYSF